MTINDLKASYYKTILGVSSGSLNDLQISFFKQQLGV